jgi:hypothetical protein
MKFKHTIQELWAILQKHKEAADWLSQRLETIISGESTKDLYLTYSLIGTKFPSKHPEWQDLSLNSSLTKYLTDHQATLQQVARIYLLSTVLEKNPEFFIPKVAKLIEVADTDELATFLRFLPLLPNSEVFKFPAVEALRTNIAPVFDAIALDNPYPAEHFNDQQWNQMYLKAAFMQRDLTKILSVEDRANKDLARIISDYAHERWAASRSVDPHFWRPVSPFLEGALLSDMKRLLESESTAENRAGALCCYYSPSEEARGLLENYPSLKEQVQSKKISWNTIND